MLRYTSSVTIVQKSSIILTSEHVASGVNYLLNSITLFPVMHCTVKGIVAHVAHCTEHYSLIRISETILCAIVKEKSEM